MKVIVPLFGSELQQCDISFVSVLFLMVYSPNGARDMMLLLNMIHYGPVGNLTCSHRGYSSCRDIYSKTKMDDYCCSLVLKEIREPCSLLQ